MFFTSTHQHINTSTQKTRTKLKKIAVLGPIPKDHITTAKGEIIEKYGCVTHPTIALSKLLGKNGTVIPVTHIRKKDEAGILELLNKYDNIDTSKISTKYNQGDEIRLKFLNQNDRVEKQTAFMHPIVPEDVKDILDCDAFVIVPITDFEVPLDTLQYLKENSNGTIIFDAHGPTTTVTTSGDRLRQFWLDRDVWLPFIDVLKMNIEEASCCWFKSEYELEELKPMPDEMDEAGLAEFAKYCLENGTGAVYITLDARGCMIYTIKDGVFNAEFVKSVWVENVVDTTGCGDSFAGGLAFGFLDGEKDFVKAAKFANALGAMRTQGKTFEVFKDLEGTMEIIDKNYN
jgi:sugar/nucleoside kinase (ribokinase family)